MVNCDMSLGDVIIVNGTLRGGHTMNNPNSRNFPAMIIYTVDCEETAGQDANQTVVYQREDTPTDLEVEDWTAADLHIDPTIAAD